MSVIIRLQGLPLTASSGDIRTFFSGLSIPDGAVNIVGGAKAIAFIGFSTDLDAMHAMRKDRGQIHNSEVHLFLSSRSEMKEVIDNARSAAAEKPPSIPPRFGGSVQSSRFERDEPPRFPPREDPRFGGEVSPYGRNGPPIGRDEPPRVTRDGSNGNHLLPSSPTPHGSFNTVQRPTFGETRVIEKEDGERKLYDMQQPNFESEMFDRRKSGEERPRNEPWMNPDREFMGGSRYQQSGDHGNIQPFSAIRQDDVFRRNSNQDIFGNGRIDGDERKEIKKKEESWRSDNNRSFERIPHPPFILNTPTLKDEDSISFFGRGTTVTPKRPLLPPPMVPSQSSIPPSYSSSHIPAVQAPKEEAYVELTRLSNDLLRPSILEEFLSPSTPLTLSSVKVVYSPEGIHMQSLVRFTSAMDAFNALKKDGEHGVKIRPSTKEAFEMARDGPPLTHSSVPIHPIHPPITHPFPPTLPIGGLPPQTAPRLNLFTMPLINPNEMMTGNERRPRDGIEEGRGERRRREDSPARGRREERGKRSISPRSKKSRADRICVLVSNLPFRAKESDIRRSLYPGLNPYAIKKIFSTDCSPSDEWIMEFSSEAEALETVRRRMECGGRQARLKIIDEPEADRLLRQKFKSPPRRGEKEGEKRDSFDEKVRMQQEAIEMENRMSGSSDFSSREKALAGAFSAPVFTTNRGFMRGGRGGGGRGMRGMNNGGMRGSRGRGVSGYGSGMGRGGGGGGVERNCLLISNMPPLPSPQVLLEHLRIIPPQLVRVDQIAPDAAIIELRDEMTAIGVAESGSDTSFPLLHGRRLLIAAIARKEIEQEFNLRGEEINLTTIGGPSHHRIDPEIVKSIGDRDCVIMCNGFPRDLSIDEVKAFFDGFPMIESSVRMRMEGGEGTGECLLAMKDRHSARRSVETLNGKIFRGSSVTLSILDSH